MADIRQEFAALEKQMGQTVGKKWDPQREPPPFIQAMGHLQRFLDSHTDLSGLDVFAQMKITNWISEYRDAQTSDGGSGSQVDRGRGQGPETPTWRR